MSQKTTRASAREIRRAFGPAAVAHLDQLERRLDALEARIAEIAAFVHARGLETVEEAPDASTVTIRHLAGD